MKNHTAIKVACLAFALLQLSSSASAQKKILNSSQIYKLAEKSTVTIVANNGTQGSGFYVAPNIVATNYHVVEGASEVYCVVTNTSVKVRATGYVAINENADLILLQVNGAPRTPLKMANGKVATGQVIYAIGAPMGMSGTISNGIVSSVRGNNILQITAAVSPGSSGGPVLNRVGEVVGVSTLTLIEGQNMNFAVGYQYVQALMQRRRSTPSSLASLRTTSQPSSSRQTASTQNGGNKVSSFRRDFSAIRIYNPETEQWMSWKKLHVTFVFNANDNGDVILYYDDGEKAVFRKVSGVSSKTDRDGMSYQEILVLNQGGDELLLRLYEDGDVILIGENGIHLSN